MAKLIGIKTIDMANGEITKVVYRGEEYAKVGVGFNDAHIGDLFSTPRKHSQMTKDAFYIVHEIHDGGISFYDDENYSNGFSRGYAHSNVFRKTSAQASPTNTDVSIADVSAKVDAIDARVSALEKADVPKPADAITHKDVEYTLVDRKAQEGDVVSVSHENGNCFKPRKLYGPCFEVDYGDISVEADSSTGRGNFEIAKVYNEYYGRTTETVLVYAPKAKPISEGDIVVITANMNSSRNRVGDIGKVGLTKHGNTSVDVPQRPYSRTANGNVTVESEMRHATPSEIAKYEQAVAEAKALAEQSAKDAKLAQVFTQAGRKPNEYRKGDIVRISESYRGFSVNKAGDIGVVETVAYFDSFRVVVDGRVGTGNHHSPKNVEIVTFAESRLDRN